MRSSTGTRAMTAVLAIACVVGLTACGNAVGKTGAPSSGATVLHLGAADVSNAQLQSFVSILEASSHHRLRVQIDRKTYFSETPGGEFKLAAALGAGKVDLGYLPSRDWAQAGAPGFAALQAPGLLTTTAQEIRVSRDPIAAELLGGLNTKGVVGLGLIPDEARRLITREPVLTTDDLKGAHIRIGDNVQTAAMIADLGGTAVQRLTAGQTKDGLVHGRLDGVETGPTPASQNSYNVPAPYLTSFAFIPKFEVLAANEAFWRKLAPADQRLVQSAATATVDRAATDVPAREASQLKLLCLGGAVIVRPPSGALSSLLAAAEKARPTDAADTTLIGRIASVIGTTGAQPDAAPVPAQCAVAATAIAAEQKHRATRQSTGSTSTSNPAQLVGTYRVDVTEQDWVKGGVVGADWNTAITFTYTLFADGTQTETQKPDFPDQGPLHGTWKVHGNRIEFISGGVGSAGDDFDETVSWSYFKGVLTLKPLVVQDQPGRVIYSVPWRKIA